MKKSAAFHEWVIQDLFHGIPGISSRSMFGGYAFYLHGKIFAISAEGALYFKTAPEHIEDFKRLKSHPFAFSSKDRKKITTSYWELPEDIMEDRDELIRWIKRSTSISPSKKKT